MELIYKLRDKCRSILVHYINRLEISKYFYKSFWHYKLFGNVNAEKENEMNFLTARPNPGAGIGHQMANWIAGYWFAKQFNLKYAHIPFTNSYTPFMPNTWDAFLGFGDGEIQTKDLVTNNYRVVRIPLFNEHNNREVAMVKKIIESYSGERVVFMCEQDQFYQNQYGVMEELKHKFYCAKSRKKDSLIYNKANYNIAIHVRRGDIVQKEGNNNDNLSMRWLDNDYFVNALRNTIDIIKTDKPIHIYLFSQGKPEDYKEFSEFENLHFCMDMSAKDSFLHMCYADALLTSRSSFSYKPALLNKGIKVCPQNFWHGYPDTDDWILMNDRGNI